MIDLIADLLSRSLLWVFLVTASVALVRYLLVAGGAWWLLWGRNAPRFAPRRLRARRPDPVQLRREVSYSLATCLMFPTSAFLVIALARWDLPRVYFYVSDYGWPYLVISVALMVLLHDALFYWSHRLLHLPWLMRHVHYRHHESENPTPWTAFAFHPVEGFIQVFNIVIIVCLIPAHPFALSAFLILNVLGNVFGHCGFELLPHPFRTRAPGRYLNSPSLHGWHHCRGDSNFGLYFTFWDDLMGTRGSPDFRSIPGEHLK